MQLLEKEQLQLRKDQEVEHAQLRKGKEALVKGHLAETEALRAELQEAAKQKDKALREQAERSAGELRTTEQLTLILTLNLISTLTPTLPLTLPLTLLLPLPLPLPLPLTQVSSGRRSRVTRLCSPSSWRRRSGELP
jgi:regulator of protease activity HflC (stomatin/prohibitin superfamily)